jgi:hypothetical protein
MLPQRIHIIEQETTRERDETYVRAERRKQWKIHWRKYKHLYKGARTERRNKWRQKWEEKYTAS